MKKVEAKTEEVYEKEAVLQKLLPFLTEVHVSAIRVDNLPVMDFKTSDPFLRVGFVREPNKAKLDKTLEQGAIGGILVQSSVLRSQLAISFDTRNTELANLKLTPEKETLQIEVWDKELIGSSQWMGCISISFKEALRANIFKCTSWKGLKIAIEEEAQISNKILEGPLKVEGHTGQLNIVFKFSAELIGQVPK